jgi:hypothetical protein
MDNRFVCNHTDDEGRIPATVCRACNSGLLHSWEDVIRHMYARHGCKWADWSWESVGDVICGLNLFSCKEHTLKRMHDLWVGQERQRLGTLKYDL